MLHFVEVAALIRFQDSYASVISDKENIGICEAGFDDLWPVFGVVIIEREYLGKTKVFQYVSRIGRGTLELMYIKRKRGTVCDEYFIDPM